MIDPTQTRLCDNFMLSDAVKSDSIVRLGLPNQFTDKTLLKAGRHLGQSVLDPAIAQFGPASITYGFISPEVSIKTVRWKNPRSPSYHRWDDGAAVDVVFHEVFKNKNELSPIQIAWTIDQEMRLPYSRMITYSESPCICLSAKIGEDPPRHAFYENRYCGRPFERPQYLSMSKSPTARTKAYEAFCACGLPYPWRGSGYPTYHGGGRRQYQHVRVSRYTVMLDFLYDKYLVNRGEPNKPPKTVAPERGDFVRNLKAAGKVVDRIIGQTGMKPSIIEAYHHAKRPFIERFHIAMIPHLGVSAEDCADALSEAEGYDIHSVKIIDKKHKILEIEGVGHE